MMRKSIGAVVLGVAALVLVPAVSADEVVHFRNGAEMAVRSHKVAGEMVTLDLGGGNSIAFPLAMVDKIASAGQDVFLNPVYHPANQAVAGAEGRASASIPVQDVHITGGASPATMRLPGGMASGPGFRGTGVVAGPESQYQRQTGLTSVPVGPRGFVRRVVLPSEQVTLDPQDQPVLETPQAAQSKVVKHLTALPQAPPAPAAPPATSDGQTEAGTPPPQSN